MNTAILVSIFQSTELLVTPTNFAELQELKTFCHEEPRSLTLLTNLTFHRASPKPEKGKTKNWRQPNACDNPPKTLNYFNDQNATRFWSG